MTLTCLPLHLTFLYDIDLVAFTLYFSGTVLSSHCILLFSAALTYMPLHIAFLVQFRTATEFYFLVWHRPTCHYILVFWYSFVLPLHFTFLVLLCLATSFYFLVQHRLAYHYILLFSTTSNYLSLHFTCLV